jgi:hypothetical protein
LQGQAAVTFLKEAEPDISPTRSLMTNDFAFEAKLTANDGTTDSFFGGSIAISGDTAIVGALVNNANEAICYVFVRSGSTWTQQAKLIPSDGTGVTFHSGLIAAISGDTVVIGGPVATINSNSNQGAAYVFVRNGTTWTEQQRLTASDGAAQDQFGGYLSIDGDTIVVGAARDDVGSNTDQGSAYIYVRQGGVWSEQAKLVANDGAANGLLGNRVSINANTVTALTGKFSGSSEPSIYVFARSGTTWVQQARLSICEPASIFGCWFGGGAVSGNTLIASNTFANNGSNTEQGVAYVFVRSGTTWALQQKLIASDGQTGDNFGQAAIEGDALLIGARNSAYVLTRSGNVWTEQQKLQINRANSIALSGNTILVGTPFETINGNLNQGAVQVFVAPGVSPTPTPTPTPTPGALQFSATAYGVNEDSGVATVTVTRTSNTFTASVNYATSDTAANNCNAVSGLASSRCDYLTTLGTLTFAPGETSKTISLPIVDDSYAEGAETFTISLTAPVGATLGSSSTATVTINDNDSVNGVNPIDTPSFFVRQHYIDFLNREPDIGGLNFWTNDINSCGSDAPCIEVKRINVSAAFFLSIEFQETGYLVYRVYKAGFGNLSGAPVPVRFNEFLRETQQIGQGVQVGIGNWQAQLEANKQAFALAYVQRADFQAAFPNTLTADQFVTQLDTNAGGVCSSTERSALVAILGITSSDFSKRALVLRAVAEDSDLKSAELNKAFVLMQYFGYMRRNPNDAPDAGFDGFSFWLNKLNSFNGNFVNAEMVKAFISSAEYRQRFGP